jgi:hypothetical protein
MKKLFRHPAIIYIVCLIPLFLLLFKITRDRVGAFGCFDDCFNITAGYFILSGKQIYRDFFFNHQPFAAYISATIQFLAKPQNLYSLILVHREVLFGFAIICDLYLVIRFGLAGFIFAIVYEPAKIYLFGDRFLAEGFIVYPAVLIMANIFASLKKQVLSRWDLILCLLSAWFIIWMREPFIPYAIFSLGLLFWLNRQNHKLKYYLSSFIILNLMTFGLFSNPDYYFNLVTVNAAQNAGIESRALLSLNGIAQILAYPWMWFYGGIWNQFRIIDSVIAALIILTAFLHFHNFKSRLTVLILYLLIASANLRSTTPGQIYYAAFHALLRFGLAVFACGLLISDLGKFIRKYYLFTLIPLLLLFYLFLSPQSYFHDQINRQAEFTTGYANVFIYGSTVRVLSNPKQTFFVDSIEELMYWQAQRLSPYKYTWFTSIMPQVPKYALARAEMFAQNPPDFYWGGCDGVRVVPPGIIKSNFYHQLQLNQKPSCLYMKNDLVTQVTPAMLTEIQKYGFSL